MARTYLISTDYLKEHTTINNNVDTNILNSPIQEAQEINVHQICGTKLYKRILDLVRTGDIALPVNVKYKELLDDYVQPVVVYWAWLYSLPYLAMKAVNKGLQRQVDENSNNANLDEVHYLEENIKDKADFFSQRLADFLLQNRTDYPEYFKNYQIDELQPTTNQAFQGVQFDGVDGCIRTMGYDWRTITL